MGTFIACYVIVWATLALYVAHLGARQRQLHRDLECLRQQVERSQQTEQDKAQAA